MDIRPEIKGIKDYVPGKNPDKPGMIKLASNENPFGPSPAALRAIAEEAKKLEVYPDQKATQLREALAKKLGLTKDNIVCGNGSDDIMQILAATYLNPEDEVVISKNTFSVYELVARIFGGDLVLVDLMNYEQDLEAMASKIGKKTKLIFLTNPHNPTGTIFSASAFESFLKKVPDNVLVVIDEAYAEFVESKDFPDSLKYVKAGRNVIVLRTFSKFYGLAGLRVGYGIASQELVAPMFRAKMPFNVNRLAQAGALAALDDKDFLNQTFKNNAEGKKYLYAELDKLKLPYKKTEANFIFIDLEKNADEVFLKLMSEGIIIRPLTSFSLPKAIRVSIGTPAQNQRFIDSIAACL